MATNLTCRDCTRNKFAILTDKWTGPAILLLRNADSGLYSLTAEVPLPAGLSVVAGTLLVSAFNAAGTTPETWPTLTYSADDVTDNDLETTGTTTAVGAVTSRTGTLKFTITFPAVPGGGFTALDDNTRIYVGYTLSNGSAERIFVGRTVEDDPCNLPVYERPCFITGAQGIVCPIDFCGGDTPLIQVDGETIGTFNDTGKLVVDNSAFAGAFGYYEPGISKVTVGFGNPGLACTSTVTYENGNETVVLNPVTVLRTYSYDLTGTDVTGPATITLNSLIVNGVDRFQGRAAIVAAAGTLDAQGASLATQLTTEMGLGTWTYTAATDVLAVQSPFVLGDLAGLDGAAAPAALTLTPTVS